LQLCLLLAVLPRPGIPAVDIGHEEKELQQQARVQLNLKEDDGKKRNVYQPKRVVNDLLQTGQPDAEQTRNRAYRFNP
jgi:hypothetical protein